jgi:hypothetical protein
MKSFFSFIAFLLMAAAFFVLIGFEIHFGVAGGKFGGVELITMPGTFWFLIGLQTGWGLSLLTDAIKEFWNFLHRKNKADDQHKYPPPAKPIAVYWIVATLFVIIVNGLAIWSAAEMVFNMYKSIMVYEMPRRAILGVIFLISFLSFCSVYYFFLFRSLVETFFPKARTAFQLLGEKKNG